MTRTMLLAMLVSGGVVIPAIATSPHGHESLGCGQCHVSHVPNGATAAPGPLWSQRAADDALPVFRLYGSPTFDALGTDIGQPDGASRLCLSCHDGSYSELSASPGDAATFGSDDLARSHPISFTYDSSLAARVPRGALRDPSHAPSGLGGTIADDLLDEKGKVQCTTCHDVHSTARGPKLLRYDSGPNSGSSNMCRVCHNM